MKTKIIILLLLMPVLVRAQYSRKGWYAGVGVGQFNYDTHWYYHNGNGTPYYDNTPGHSSSKTTLLLSLEKRSLFKIKTLFVDANNEDSKWYFDFDAGGELMLGISGKTTGDHLPDDDVVSSGGFSPGAAFFFRPSVVFPTDNKIGYRNTVFYLSLGPQFSMLHNNGKGLQDFATKSYYNYADGWNEYLVMLDFAVGIKFEWSSFDITPELRINVPAISTASTTWQPNGGDVIMQDPPMMWGLNLKISKPISWPKKK